MFNLTVVNMFGGVGVGKSTHAARLFTDLKSEHYACELVQEAAKQMIWDESKALTDQVLIGALQFHSLFRLVGKTFIAIMDIPLLQTTFHSKDWVPYSYYEMINTLNNKFHNINFYIERTYNVPYEVEGRMFSYEQAIQSDIDTLNLLRQSNTAYTSIKYGDYARILQIVKDSI